MSTLIKRNGAWVKVAGNTIWTGTKAQLQAALDAGELADGTAVMVTDDYEEETPVETITPVAVTGGAAGTITWDNFYVTKVGKVVSITINNLAHTNDVSSVGDIILATGLPKPATGRVYLTGIYNGSVFIDSNGRLGIDIGFTLSSSKLYGSCSYITAD